MRLVITDTGNVWNPDNPFLERFKEIVLVVCLNGKVVTDKYECFVVPEHQTNMESEEGGLEDPRLQALASVAGELKVKLFHRDDVVFLSDDEPSSLYPYYVIKEINEYNRLHLVAMSPWPFERNDRIHAYKEIASTFSGLVSVLYYDSREVLKELPQKATIPEAYEYARDYLGNEMTRFLNEIYVLENQKYFYDFTSMSYVPLKNAYDKRNDRRNEIATDIAFPVELTYSMLGFVVPASYPPGNTSAQDAVESLPARIDGKKICNILREQRLRLARMNSIPFESEECPIIGPCAGTCEKCDKESKYLQKQMKKILEMDRNYPQFDPHKEVSQW